MTGSPKGVTARVPGSLTCVQEGPAAPVAGPDGGLGELVGRHPVEDPSDAAVAPVPPARGAGRGPPRRAGRAQAVQHQGPAEREKHVSPPTRPGPHEPPKGQASPSTGMPLGLDLGMHGADTMPSHHMGPGSLRTPEGPGAPPSRRT